MIKQKNRKKIKNDKAKKLEKIVSLLTELFKKEDEIIYKIKKKL